MSGEPELSDEQKSLSGHAGFKKFFDQVPDSDRELFLEILLDAIYDVSVSGETGQESDQDSSVAGTGSMQPNQNP